MKNAQERSSYTKPWIECRTLVQENAKILDHHNIPHKYLMSS